MSLINIDYIFAKSGQSGDLDEDAFTGTGIPKLKKYRLKMVQN